MINQIFYILLFIVCCYILFYYIKINTSIRDLEIFKNIKLNTGDLILIKYKSYVGVLNTHLTKNRYLHPALVVDGEQKKIIHMTSDKDVVIESLQHIYTPNNELLEMLILPIKKPIDNNVLSEISKKYINFKYDRNLNLIFVGNKLVPQLKSINRTDSKSICTEFIVEILIDLGVIKDSKLEPVKYNINNFIDLQAYDKKRMIKLVLPQKNFYFGFTFLYTKILELIPLPKLTPMFT
jgi:hypothetical protein